MARILDVDDSTGLQSGTVVDPQDAAESVGLVHVSDSTPGITRRRAGKGFSYRDPEGKLIRDKAELARIKALAVPPAYDRCVDLPGPERATCRPPAATPRGASSTAITRAFARCATARNTTSMLDFAAALPGLRERVDADMRKRGHAARKGAGHHRASAGSDDDPRRQRRIRQAEQVSTA